MNGILGQTSTIFKMTFGTGLVVFARRYILGGSSVTISCRRHYLRAPTYMPKNNDVSKNRLRLYDLLARKQNYVPSVT